VAGGSGARRGSSTRWEPRGILARIVPPAAGVESEDASGSPALRRHWFAEAARDVQLTRALLASGLGFIYLVGFAILVQQGLPLLGEHGIMPMARFLERVRAGSASGSEAFWAVPSLFWLSASDAVLQGVSCAGAVLALLVTVGFGNAPVMFALWALYGSFVHAGQTFYGYGWEMLLLESGFLGIFLVPPWRPLRTFTLWPGRALHPPEPLRVPSLPVIWLFRWLTFRVMFGAGLIKLRGDSCWTDLTCLVYHYETQPNPHPLSWLLHQAPPWFHAIGVLFNHFVEVVVPFGVFGPRRLRHWAGAFIVAFQVFLILSGNLSFLNWLTLVVALACFDDSFWRRWLPPPWLGWARDEGAAPQTRAERIVGLVLFGVIALLSINPVANLHRNRIGQQRWNPVFDVAAFGNGLAESGPWRAPRSVGLRCIVQVVITRAYRWRRSGARCERRRGVLARCAISDVFSAETPVR
jgi:Lipase maturation factor